MTTGGVARGCTANACIGSVGPIEIGERRVHAIKAGARRRSIVRTSRRADLRIVFVLCKFDDRVGRVARYHTHLAA